MLALALGTSSLLVWLLVAMLPWRPWANRETLEAAPDADTDISCVTILIPARNEGELIQTTLSAILQQTQDSPIIVVDDQSTDNTRQRIAELQSSNIRIIDGQPMQAGWSGKLHALEQGRQHVNTPYLLLLDADIVLQPGTLASLLKKLDDDDLAFVSLMARLKMQTAWEKLLMPAFIYFFKLLYPFHLSNTPGSRVAAAAGGCILLKTEALQAIGGFAAIKDALIDDCALARAFKQQGHKTWIGLTHSAISLRNYPSLRSIWQMVTRTAFTQLHYSYSLLLLCLIVMSLSYPLPTIGMFYFDGVPQWLCLSATVLLLALYLPTLRFYQLNPLWTLSLPFAALLYMLMTLDSARRHTLGTGAEWKERHYSNG